MPRSVRPPLLSVPLLVLAGCAGTTQLTRAGAAVQVTENSTAVQECEFIAALSLTGDADENALRALRNEAASRGANTVLLVRRGGTVARTEGYLCAD